MSANINVTEGNKASVCQADFLGNSYNKQRLIKIIIDHMQAVSINVKQAIGDADTMIVGTAMQCATSSQEVVVIGTDTDLLVMLVA